MRFTTAVALATLCLSTAVEAHSVVTEVKGANGVKGVGMGVTDLSGKKLRLFNQVQTIHCHTFTSGLNPVVAGIPIRQGR